MIFLVGAILTLLYLVRLFYLVFLGEARTEAAGEKSSLMVASVLALALIGVSLGAFIYYPATYVDMLTTQLGVNLE